MRENLDDEAYYEGEDANGGRQSERARDQHRAWLTQQGWDAYVDDNGALQSWYPGMDYPDPVRRVTRDNQAELDREFLRVRLQRAVLETAEGKWLLEQGLFDPTLLGSYETDGSVGISFKDEADAARFSIQFRAGAN
ncbi:hypothetical protein ASF00_09250 [Sphingomonas sp. Leaf34]|nr:hypothetical protein ASF00_09250 [Sphingomonas sp. Leaf34]